MTFLAPIPALIAAALTVPLLLVLYFLKLRRRPVRVSSTLLWRQATHDLQVNVPFRWIRPSLMLLLHLAVLAMLLLAMARPAVRMDAAPADRVVLLIDRSASMGAQDAEGGGGGADGGAGQRRLDAAKARAVRTLEDLSRSGRAPSVAVVAFGAEARALTVFTQDRGAARAAISAIEASDQPGDLDAALRLASAMLAGGGVEGEGAGERGSAARDGERGLVILFSDGSFAGDGGHTLAGAEFRFERIGPIGEGAGRENLGIVALAARREWADPGTVRVFARIQNVAAREVGATAVLRLDGRELERRAVIVPAVHGGDPEGGEEAERAESAITPGEASITFELATREGGVLTLSLLSQDLLPADNTASVVLRAATKPRVLLVVPDEAIDRGERDPGWILATVLEEMELPMRRAGASAFEADSASRVALRADLVIFDRVRPRVLPGVPSLSFGTGIPADGLELGGPTEAGTYFLAWSRTDPLLREVSLDSVYVSRPMVMRIDEGSGAGWRTIARGRSGPLIVTGEAAGARRVVVGFELAQSNWPLHFGFPIFIASAVDVLTLRGEAAAGLAFTTSEPVRFSVSGEGRLAVEGPREVLVDVTREGGGAGIPVSLGVFDRAGVYRVRGGVEGAPPAVAVNLLDETESAISVAGSLRIAGQSVSGIGAERGPREVWHWFVLAALMLLLAEWIVGGWMMKA